jgi:hypothetical protein
MAYRLKSRVHQIPGGFRFVQPEIRWDSAQVVGNFPSWEQLINAVIEARVANPVQRDKHKWATDVESVASEVDRYNTANLLSLGHTKYIVGDDGARPSPILSPPSSLRRSVGNAVAGSEVLVEWLASDAEAVPLNQSEQRAGICAACPENQSGDLLSFFTQPVSEAIRAALNLRSSWKLSTIVDSQLGVCQACGCPLKLKVHVPIDFIRKRLDQETMARLHSACWIPKE